MSENGIYEIVRKRRRGMIGFLAVALWFGLRHGVARGAATTQPSDIAIDFSCAGYAEGSPLPEVKTVRTLQPSGGDDSGILQAALAEVGTLPVGSDGFRGALQLSAGHFLVSGHLDMADSGVVLRGATDGKNHTTIFAAGQGRRTLIEVGRCAGSALGDPIQLVDETVPAGSCAFTLTSTDVLTVGDRIIITRPSNAAWIHSLGMDQYQGVFQEKPQNWTAGSRNLLWHRVVTAIDAAKKTIVIDAPITTAIEAGFGGATVRKATDAPLTRIGIEDCILESAVDPANAHDEEHAWIAIALNEVEDSWVRRVQSRHFVSSCVRVGPGARRVTVEDCRCEQPISEAAGYRRQSFLVEGEQVLVRGCRAESGMNDFAVGLCAAGPNVFLNCTAERAIGPSGSFESWASGALYERVNVEGAGIRLTRDDSRALAAGWTAANCVIWNCGGNASTALGPMGAENILVTSADSLYETQRARRRPNSSAPSAPGANVDSPRAQATRKPPPGVSHPIQIINGRFVIDAETLWGGAVNDAWWKGQPNPANSLDSGVSITRFIPGRTGPGLTEDLPALAQKMKADGTPFYQAGPPIWYDRRRDEHSLPQRPDANVWAPFCEMPWARTGTGIAWDGLSRYDLTQYNPWYFDRTREFSGLCDQFGLVLYHNLYNTHNLLEWGAHWADCPWRPANNINDTGLPEPPPLEPFKPGDLMVKVHLANQVYNADDPRLRAIHHAYILHELDQLGSFHNVIFSTAFQFPGPLAFQRFFQDTVAEWEKSTGKTVRLALATSKDIEDAILQDPVRSKQIAVIDLRYWQYRPDGSLWAPPGGKNEAFREAATRDFGKSMDFPTATTPLQVYRQVREYHDRYPDKAIVAWNGGVGPIPTLMAGGAQSLSRNPTGGHGQGGKIDRTTLDGFVQRHLAPVLMNMNPRDGLLADASNNWALADKLNDNLLFYSLSGNAISVTQPLNKAYTGLWFDPRTGATRECDRLVSLVDKATITKPSGEDWLLFLTPMK